MMIGPVAMYRSMRNFASALSRLPSSAARPAAKIQGTTLLAHPTVHPGLDNMVESRTSFPHLSK
jgi:hypothetical protein